MPAHTITAQILDEAGIEVICALIFDGQTIGGIAAAFGVARSVLHYWIANPLYPDRAARVKEARIIAASAWDERAEAAIIAAKDMFEIQKARELASHYRWRAKAIAPRDYGDRLLTDEKSAEADTTLVIKGGLPDA